MHGATEVIRQARQLNPRVRVLARTAYVREMAALRTCGAEPVFSGEGEVALAMTVALLRDLGATPDQIDRERDRVRAELLGRWSRHGRGTGGPADYRCVPRRVRVMPTSIRLTSPSPLRSANGLYPADPGWYGPAWGPDGGLVQGVDHAGRR